jgi:hypothetical protein
VQRDERLAQRRVGDAEAAAQLPLGGQPGARHQQTELDRGAKPFDGFLERRL